MNLAQQEHSQRDKEDAVRESERERDGASELRSEGLFMGERERQRVREREGEAEGTCMVIWSPQSDSDF